ncbi:hypothetical protein F183_A18120 [Bryobacterales bacterium F-183]|nr:hypothetical protein F183_A18120 [Bryobacterales bacterium F-183]
MRASRFLLCLTPLLALAQSLPPKEAALLKSIRANTLKAHVSFLASDLLEGRDTPSRGLDIAGEYIAAQFRRVGLEPAGDNATYFQIAPYLKITQPLDNFRIRVELPDGGKAWESTGAKVMPIVYSATNLANLEVVKVALTDEAAKLPAPETVKGKAVILVTSQRVPGLMAKRDELLAMQPAVVITGGFVSQQPRLRPASTKGAGIPIVVTSDSDFTKFAADLPAGPTAAKLTLQTAAPVEEQISLRNVVAKLPGSDPALSKQVVLLTAHYDHVGIAPRGDGDRINNGANDDASGVATVLTLAEAFASRSERPRRTLVFMTYFGEEKGLFGSRHYAEHPLFPLKDTAANLNFEHMGRTDDAEGPKPGKITASGFDYTTIGEVLTQAGKDTDVEAWKHEKNSDAFFGRSDNQALADAGVPALTLAVTWIFPDYHRPTDHWDKIDYTNMERVVRTCALTAERIADTEAPPHWITTNPKVEKYAKAAQALATKTQ